MIEERILTKDEFDSLLDSAPESETRNLKRILGSNAYDYLMNNTKEISGIVNSRPIYFGALSKENQLWTIVNSDVKEQFSLYKISKRRVYKWLDKYGVIYATMEKVNLKNILWTIKLGFKKIKEDLTTITFKLGG